MKIKIDITSDSGNHTLTATLTENSSAKAFYELLKNGSVTIDMHDYGSFEKVGLMGISLPRNDREIRLRFIMIQTAGTLQNLVRLKAKLRKI